MVIFTPAYLTAINRFKKSSNKVQLLIRDGVLLLLALLIMYSGYMGTLWFLNQLSGFLTLAYMSPVVPLVLILLILSIMLIISTIANAVGSFYLSDDLDLLLASPLHPFTFFYERLTLVILGTSSVSLVFLFPVFAAYFVRFNQDFTFVLLVIAALVPFFLASGALAFMIGTVLVLFVPLKRSKILLAVFIFLLLGTIWVGVDLISMVLQARAGSQELIRLIKVFTSAELPWLPSTWIGEIISMKLGISHGIMWSRYGALYGTASVLATSAYLVFLVFHRTAYSSMRNHRIGKAYQSKVWRRLVRWISNADRQWLSIAVKDYKLFTRDMSQIFQGVLLLGIFLMYVYNLRTFAGFASVGSKEAWWVNLLFVSNFCMSAFISTAICTRFVFPSISLEGRSFSLVLMKAPYSLHDYVRGKFFFWYGIVAIVHSLVVGVGTAASGGKTIEIVLSILCSWILCYGLVGLAVGMGAIYSRFDWESASQLSVGFGNIIFMLSASSLILLNIFPIWALYRYINWVGLPDHMGTATLVALAFCITNFSIGYIALRRGISRLALLSN